MKFIWEESDSADTWEKRLAKRYYDKLFKEYCICDLSYYKINKIAMRWRIEKEVVEGKGQFICGEKKCTVRDGLRSWEGCLGFAFICMFKLAFIDH
jgi:protein FRA10AC1